MQRLSAVVLFAAAAASAPFSPANLPGLVVWLDCSVASSLTLDAYADITAWASPPGGPPGVFVPEPGSTGFGVTRSAANRHLPIVNLSAPMRDNALISAAPPPPALGADVTIAWIGTLYDAPAAAAAANVTLLHSTPPDVSSGRHLDFFVQPGAGSTAATLYWLSSVSDCPPSTCQQPSFALPVAANERVILVASFDAAASTLEVTLNGAAAGRATLPQPNVVTGSVVTALASFPRADGEASFAANAAIHEVIVAGKLSDADMRELLIWASHKWDIQGR